MTEPTADNSNVPLGGKRPGAGRKPDIPGEKRVLITARVSPVTARKLKARSDKTGEGVGKVIDDLAKKLPGD